MKNINNSKPLIDKKELINSYVEYIQLIRKYNDKFIDKNIKSDSKTDVKYLILDYLNFKYENGEKWVKNLILIIREQEFLSQNILISIFYLDIFDLIIKPKCLNINLKEKLYPHSKFFSYK